MHMDKLDLFCARWPILFQIEVGIVGDLQTSYNEILPWKVIDEIVVDAYNMIAPPGRGTRLDSGIIPHAHVTTTPKCPSRLPDLQTDNQTSDQDETWPEINRLSNKHTIPISVWLLKINVLCYLIFSQIWGNTRIASWLDQYSIIKLLKWALSPGNLSLRTSLQLFASILHQMEG